MHQRAFVRYWSYTIICLSSFCYCIMFLFQISLLSKGDWCTVSYQIILFHIKAINLNPNQYQLVIQSCNVVTQSESTSISEILSSAHTIKRFGIKFFKLRFTQIIFWVKCRRETTKGYSTYHTPHIFIKHPQAWWNRGSTFGVISKTMSTYYTIKKF